MIELSLNERKELLKSRVNEAVDFYFYRIKELMEFIQSKNYSVELAEKNFEDYYIHQVYSKDKSISDIIENEYLNLKDWKQKNPVIQKSWDKIEKYLGDRSYSLLPTRSHDSLEDDFDELKSHSELISIREIIHWEYDEYFEKYDILLECVAEALKEKVTA
jgi:hypothetical protein